ncbi:nuclear-transcribed mRNA catabolic process, deadenylation-dependent decay [Bonamia ostreae]
MTGLPPYKFGMSEELNSTEYGIKAFEELSSTNQKGLKICLFGQQLEEVFLPEELKTFKYEDFAGPFINEETKKNSFTLPYCYYSRQQSLKTSTFQKLPLKTLFYIFYDMPRDQLQYYAAMELYKRNWRYHKKLQKWYHYEAKSLTWNTFDLDNWKVSKSASKVDSNFNANFAKLQEITDSVSMK